MRNISFFATTEQIMNGTKDVTRRLGWANLKEGELLQPVLKGQGLKKGENVVKLRGPIRVVSVRREPLEAIVGDFVEVAREGFVGMSSRKFVKMFCEMNKCMADQMVTRIQFTYTD